METQTHPTQLFFSLGAGSGAKLEKNADGTAMLRGLEVFKAGTFRDSVGEQRTWTPDELRQMVENFDLLRTKGIFVDPPMRKGHTRNVDNLIGYLAGAYTDGSKLRTDVALTEPDAVARYERGTFRARSAEIGAYQANDDSMYWPVLKGVAFVDMGAVEGLYEKQKELESAFVIFDNKENSSVTTDQEWVAAATYAQWEQAANHAQALVDWERAATYAQACADLGAVPASFAQNGTLTFAVNGAATTDVAAVQAHIVTLEKFVTDSREVARKEFVKGLASTNKITQPQVESLTDLAVGMTDEQFTKFKTSYEGAPALALLSTHGGGPTNATGEPVTAAEKFDQLEGVVKMFRQGGMTEEQIEQTPSFKELKALKASA